MITLEDVIKDEEVEAFVKASQKQLNALGYTEHSYRHIGIVSKTGTAVSDISAALILADKSDVHRDRVTNTNMSTFDIHDRVNYAVTDANLEIDAESRKVILNLTIDTQICPVLDYFQIFMDRTMMSKYAAKYLHIWFELVINGTKLL